MDTQIGNNNFTSKNPSHFRLWLVVISVIVVVGTLAVLVIYRGTLNFGGNNNPQPTSSPDHGVFLDKGQLDYWENRYGRVQLGISDENSNVTKKYFVNLSSKTEFFKDISSDGERENGNVKIVPGALKEIKEAFFVEIYLDSPYKNVEARATTIIYWE